MFPTGFCSNIKDVGINLLVMLGKLLRMWVKQCHKPSPVTIFIGGMVTIPKRLVYGIVLPALVVIPGHTWNMMVPTMIIVWY